MAFVLFSVIIYPCMAFENLAAFSSSPRYLLYVDFCLQLLLFCYVYSINVGYKTRYCHEYIPLDSPSWFYHLHAYISHWDLYVFMSFVAFELWLSMLACFCN